MIKFLAELTVNFFKRNISPLAFVYAGSRVDKTSRIHRGCKVRHSEVGAHSYVAAGSWLTNVEVGRFCSIGNNVAIGLATHTLNHLSSSPLFTLRRNATGVSWV
ncbi:MAG: antibiotic acetyltransferase, partial [Bacteroidaceae bacterium]